MREAVDFCRYYSQCLGNDLGIPIDLPGPTGEQNQLLRFGRGVFVCISPWNFPIAIFIGQISAALAAGNCVIAKSSSQTPLTAMLCIQLMHQAGIPKEVLQFLPAKGSNAISQYLLSDLRLAGVAFTGAYSDRANNQSAVSECTHEQDHSFNCRDRWSECHDSR